MDQIQLKLCDIQGRLFELSTDYEIESFIRAFMTSEVAIDDLKEIYAQRGNKQKTVLQ